MFDKRLFAMAPGIGRLIVGKVACLWVGLLANIGFMVTLVTFLARLTGLADGRLIACDAPAGTDCPTNVFGLAPLSLSPTDAAIFVAVLVACAAVRYISTVLAARCGTEAAERVKLGLRERLYRKMLALGPSYSSRAKTSDIVQSSGEGIEQIQAFFELFLPQLFYAVLAPITLFFVVLPLNLPVAVTLLVCAPLIVLIVGLVAMSAARVFKKYWGRYTDMGAAFLDDLTGLETLKAFDADGRAAADMDEKAETFRVMTMRVLQIQLRSLSAMDLVAYGGTAAGIGVALWQYFDTDVALSVAGVLLIVLLSADFFIPLRQLGSYFHVAMNGMTSTKRIFALLDAPDPQRGERSLPEDVDGLTVRFDGVGYIYEDGEAEAETEAAPALPDVTFAARPGQVTAIVGVSGSGKSTAAALLAGTLTGYSGSIVLGVPGDGASSGSVCELSDLDMSSLARAVTLVGARSHLFAGTLRDNLMLAAADDASDEELWHALERARIADFVRSQPQGLDMAIASGAANLSGGQRQRVAIARALLHDSPIMVFDEATSSVDVESETLILETIGDLAAAGKTVIMITHRMANAVDAGQIAVFERGRVVETGTHAALLAADGVYAKLYRTQQRIESIAHPTARTGARETALPQSSTMTAASSEGAQVASSDTLLQSTSHAETDSALLSHGESRAVPTSVPLSSREESRSAPASPLSPSNEESPTAPTPSRPSSPEGGAAAGDGGSGLSNTALIARLLTVARPLAHLMTAASVTGTLGHLAATFLPVFGMVAVFALAGNPVWGMGAIPAIIAMAVCAVLRGAMRYVEQFLNHNVAFRLLALFRSKAFAALRALAPAKVSGKGKGDLVALITTDVELLEIFFAHTISPVVIAVTTSVIYAIALATLNPWMALLLIISHLIIGVLVPKYFAVGVRGLGPTIRRQASSLDDRVLDDMRGLDEIIRFGRGEARVADIVRRTKALWAEHMRLSNVNGRFAAIGGLLVFALTVTAAVIAFALAAVPAGVPFAGQTRIPSLVVAFVLIASSFGPTLALAALPANLTSTFAAARRLFALMDEAPAVVERGNGTPGYLGMAMDHVSFGYGDDGSSGDGDDDSAEVLHDVSLDVPRTGVLGIQGPSGRGKSTMLKLLMRYWDPTRGTVTMSGLPLPAIDAHHRRSVQTLMTQETHLFDGTIRDNLVMALPDGGTATSAGSAAIGVTGRETTPAAAKAKAGDTVGREARRATVIPKPDCVNDQRTGVAPTETTRVSEEQNAGSRGNHGLPAAPSDALDARLRAALDKASALELVDSLPKGLDTPVGELGDRLSEGERQRIGLARIFLRDGDLMLFDEPTSRLDALNEAVILGSINELAHGDDPKAVVLVSHRESAMRIADTTLTV